MEGRELIIALSKKYNNDWDKIYDYIKNGRPFDLDEKYVEKDEKIITILDKEYPKSLLETFKPPFVIYYKGDLSALDNPNLIYFIGTEDFGYPKENKVIRDGKNIVFGNNDLVLLNMQEYYVSAFCKKIAITKEINKKNILLITQALNNFGRDLYVVPTSTKSFNNELIKEGAFLLDDLSDLIERN